MSEHDKELEINTRVVHAGEHLTTPVGTPSSLPIYATTTFTYETMREMDEVFAGSKEGYVYTRHGNPSVRALEEAVRTLEGGADACAFGSGMAAIHAALLACVLTPGATVIASQDLYGATGKLLQNVFGPFGVKTEMVDFTDLNVLDERVRELKPRVLVAETISNPLLKVCDIKACAQIAHDAGAKLIVDNTFATPFLCRPLALGADLVVHSATKYLGGHGDATGGLVVSRVEADAARLVAAMKLAGGILSVWEAHEILRGVKTLALRMERQCSNALRLAEHLSAHMSVARVHYPLLAGESQRELVGRVLRMPFGGALVTIELRENTRDAAFCFMDALRLCVRATSLGDVFTGALHPATASHRDLSPERRQELGITEGLVRISVGIEDVKDIIDDIDRALVA